MLNPANPDVSCAPQRQELHEPCIGAPVTAEATDPLVHLSEAVPKANTVLGPQPTSYVYVFMSCPQDVGAHGIALLKM